MSKSTGQSPATIVNPQGTDTEMLKELQEQTFAYFIDCTDPDTGLIADKTKPGWACSIAVVGLGLSCYVVGVERGYISRSEAAARTLKILKFFWASQQSDANNATGYMGFYYHFLDMHSGCRVWNSELSVIDTAILMAGVLTAAQYFNDDNNAEREIRDLADKLYRRVDWGWATNGKATLTHGWKPESGFLDHRWDNGYSEAHILYILALGSPTHAISNEGYEQWLSTFEWKEIYGTEYLYAGPLFIHQMSQMWLDFRKMHDSFNRKYGVDYFENSRRATLVQHEYAIKNPMGFECYGRYCWGLSASDGPGPAAMKVKGVERTFYDYIARGAPFGPDDGTVSPWAVVASLPFAPEIVLDTIRHAIERLNLIKKGNLGFHASFNATFPHKEVNPNGWVSEWQFGLNQGPVVMMIENYWSGLIWKVFGKSPYIIEGLRKAGFKSV